MLVNALLDLKMFGLRRMDLMTLLKLSRMIAIHLDPRVLSWLKLKLLKYKLKVWNRDVFGDLDTKLGDLVEKVKALDDKEQIQSRSQA